MPIALLTAALILAAPSQRAHPSDDLCVQALDTRSDAPIEGARVYRSYTPNGLLRQYEPFAGNDGSIGRTNSLGVACLERGYLGADAESILVTADGYESHLQPLGPGAAFARGCGVICLHRLRELVGQVHDPDGAPEDGALQVVVTAWLANPDRAALVPVSVLGSFYQPTEFFESVRPDGSFGPVHVPRADLMTVQVEHPPTGYRSEPLVIASSGPLPHMDVFLPERATISVRAPVAGGEAAIVGSYFGSYRAAVESRERGWRPLVLRRVGSERFEVLARVRPGRVRVGLALDARGSWFFRPLDVAPGEVVDLTLEWPVFRPISGRVADPAGVPVQGAWVSWWSRDSHSLLQRDPPPVRTALDGSFRLEQVLADSRPGELRVRLQGTEPARVASLVGIPPGTAQHVVLAERGTGTLTVHIEADGAENVWCKVARRGGSAPQPQSQEWSLSSGLRKKGARWGWTQHVLVGGAYHVFGYEDSGQCRAAEASVVVEPGMEVEVALRLEVPGTLELRPPTGALLTTPVTLRRGNTHVVGVGQNPILPTPIALAPGPVTVEWEWPVGTQRSSTVRMGAGTVVTVSLDG